MDTQRAPSTCGVYATALRFLYDITLDRPAVAARIPRRRVPERLPTILSTAEVEHLLAAVPSPKHRAMRMTAYGTGLRVSEIVALRTTDLDRDRLLIRVRAGKGGHDRDVPLSPRLLTVLRGYWHAARPPGAYLFPREPARASDLPQGRLRSPPRSPVPGTSSPPPRDWRTLLRRLTGVHLARCPRCPHGTYDPPPPAVRRAALRPP